MRIAVEMVREGLISREEAVLRVDPDALEPMLHPTLDPAAEKKLLSRGLPASPGAATGHVVFHADDAERAAGQGKPVILVRMETSPEDVHGMKAARGVLTARGGMTSHAAVVARGMGKCCVVGCGAASIDVHGKTMTVGERIFLEGDWISLDGSTGEVMLGQLSLAAAEPPREFHTVLKWADQVRRGRLAVRANADTGEDATKAREFGAEGIGLCRTEHMFLAPDRLPVVRRMILAATEAEEAAALEELRREVVGRLLGGLA